MSSFQSKLERASINLNRKLFDNQIKIMGKEVKVTRVKLEKNKYEDIDDIQIIKKDEIVCVINYPIGGVPLNRVRSDGFTQEVKSTNIYLFDIIPIDIYTKWQDNVERGDIIIDKVLDENNNVIKFILQVSEVLGEFRTSLRWKKSQAAPFNDPSIPPEIQIEIDSL